MSVHLNPKEPGEKKEINKQLVIRALTEPRFRKMLASDPARALKMDRVTAQNKDEIRFLLSTVKAIEFQIAALADELLCANGGCGIG